VHAYPPRCVLHSYGFFRRAELYRVLTEVEDSIMLTTDRVCSLKGKKMKAYKKGKHRPGNIHFPSSAQYNFKAPLEIKGDV
jgi:hypothetical protein